MSNFLIFKATFNNSATPAIGTYTAEGAAAYFNRNLDLSPDYYLYGKTSRSAIRWFVPTAETTDFEFVADILTTELMEPCMLVGHNNEKEAMMEASFMCEIVTV